MKLIKSEKDNWVRNIEGGGLFTAMHTAKMAELSGTLDYKGPKMPKEMWLEVLSFFKWTYDTTKSESQVRLFVSQKLGTWKAWAFPQQAETGLTTKELETDDARKQRAQLFENDADWVAWGTVHHHCGISAFQSGTDEHDEKNQGGLHITVGDMDKPHHSIHCRIYHQGDLYEPDMDKFWDIGDELERLSPILKKMLPDNAEDALARQQMCVPSTMEFPVQWKLNMIKVEREPVGFHGMINDMGWDSGYDSETNIYKDRKKGEEKDGDVKWFSGDKFVRKNGCWEKEKINGAAKHRRAKGSFDPLPLRKMEGLKELMDTLAIYQVEESRIFQLLNTIIEDELICAVFQACKDYDLLPEDLMEELESQFEHEAKGVKPTDLFGGA